MAIISDTLLTLIIDSGINHEIDQDGRVAILTVRRV